MKTTVTIENGKVTVQIDDQEPKTARAVRYGDKIVVTNGQDPLKTYDATTEEIAPTSKTERSKKYIGNGRVPLPKKNCLICGEEYQPVKDNQTLCGKPECKKEKHRRYQAERYKKKNPGAGSRSKDKDVGEAHWCKHCMAYGTHRTSEHHQVMAHKPLNLAEGSKPETELRSVCCDATVEEAEDKHRCLGCGHLCETKEYTPPFKDPWDCGACREGQALCRLHRDLQAAGKKPPTYRNNGGAAV